MNEKKKDLLLRVASAVVLLPLVLAILWIGGIPTIALVGLASLGIAWEILRMVGVPLRHPAAIVALAATPIFAWGAADVASRWPAILTLLAVLPIASMMLATLAPPEGDLRKAAPVGAWSIAAPIYAGLLLSAVVGLRSLPGQAGLTWTLLALVVTWANDTGAYFAGNALGKHRLAPKVSPNKTWEGFAGGMAASVLGCYLVRLWDPSLSHLDCWALGVVGSVLGPLGDLSESMLKRAHGVKDSGRILPGHGGLFDRLDALLFVAPWVWLYAAMRGVHLMG